MEKNASMSKQWEDRKWEKEPWFSVFHFLRAIRKAINKDPNSLLYSMQLNSHPSKMKSHQIFTCSLLGNKVRSLEKTRQYARGTGGGFPATVRGSCTYVVILLFVTVEITHDRFGFSSIWPFLAFSFVPTLLLFFIKLDFHLNRFCYSENTIDSNEGSQGNLFTGRWCPGMYRPFLIHTCFLPSCLVGAPSVHFHLQTCLSWIITYTVTLNRQQEEPRSHRGQLGPSRVS